MGYTGRLATRPDWSWLVTGYTDNGVIRPVTLVGWLQRQTAVWAEIDRLQGQTGEWND